MDVYHYGDEIERCRVTFQLMDKNRDNEINLKEFEEYINLLIAAIRKVHPGSSENLFSSKDIRDLFNKIVNNSKQNFSYQDFEKVYLEKPELLSWIDYFKNNDEDVLFLIHNNLKSLIFILHTFFESFSKVIKETSNGSASNEDLDFSLPIQEIEKFCKAIEKKRKIFLNSAGRFNIRTVFEKLTRAFNDNFNIDHSPDIVADKTSYVKNYDFNMTKFSTNMNNDSGNKNVNLNEITNLPENVVTHGKDSKFRNHGNHSKKEFLPMFMKLDSQLINDQFKSIKNNINDHMDEIDEENIDEEHDEDPLYEKDRRINEKKMNVKVGLHKQLYKENIEVYLDEKYENIITNKNENDISKIDDLVIKSYKKSFDNNKNEVIFFDDIIIKNKNENSNIEDSIMNDKELLLKYNSASRVIQDDLNLNGDIQIEDIKEINKSENTENKNNTQNMRENVKFRKNLNYELFEIPTKNNSGPFKLNDSSKLNFNQTIGNLNVESEKLKVSKNAQNSSIIKLCKKLKKLSEISCQSVKWIEQSYKWVENRYLKDHLIKLTPKEVIKNTKTHIGNDLRFSVQNIPKITQEKSKKRDKKEKNNLLKANDDNFKILLNVVMGIQLAVQSTPSVKITADDKLDNYLNSLTYSIQTTNFGSKRQETFYIKEYAGIIFNNLRKLYDIDKDTFISSISPQDFITGIMISGSTIIEELCSTGKSGSLFYYTRDGKYILKTISNTEYSFFKKILPNYFKHLYNNKYSLLPKFFGCYKLVRKVKKHKSRVHFVIMQNIFSTNKEIHLRYDLKGSKIGRQVLKDNEKIDLNSKIKLSYALKDLDLEKNKQIFPVGDKRETIMEQLERDTKFLTENNIIDYSLLVGIHVPESENKNLFETQTNELLRRKKEFRTLSPNRVVNTQINNRNAHYSMVIHREKIELNKECKSLDEKQIKILTLDDEDVNISEYSLYDKEVNFSEDFENSFKEENNNVEHPKHPYQDYDDGGIKSVTNKETYFLGIIDILTEYNCTKKLEYMSKLLYYCSSKMSSVPPNSYRKRFNSYMKDKFVDSNPQENLEQISEPMKPINDKP